MILSDAEIQAHCPRHIKPEANMINPFVNKLIRERDGNKVISYGLSSYGYDLRLSPTEFFISEAIHGFNVDPKRFRTDHLRPMPLHKTDAEAYFILPAFSYGLGVALERLNIPDDITVLCIGKSTYARCGLIANLTPAEAGWKGHLTLELSNNSSSDVRIYANEGIVQLLFFRGSRCRTTYNDRDGKYNNQPQKVTVARV